jgi:short-subunit dehydrogenase
MRAQKRGKIVNISSIGGKVSFPLGGWYHASKFAFEGYSDTLRIELRSFGIDVVVIEPAGIESEWARIATEQAQRYSGRGAYADLVAAQTNSAGWNRKMPPAKVITDLVVKILRIKRPRARYHGGTGAGTILFLRWMLPDGVFDRLIMRLSK